MTQHLQPQRLAQCENKTVLHKAYKACWAQQTMLLQHSCGTCRQNRLSCHIKNNNTLLKSSLHAAQSVASHSQNKPGSVGGPNRCVCVARASTTQHAPCAGRAVGRVCAHVCDSTCCWLLRACLPRQSNQSSCKWAQKKGFCWSEDQPHSGQLKLHVCEQDAYITAAITAVACWC